MASLREPRHRPPGTGTRLAPTNTGSPSGSGSPYRPVDAALVQRGDPSSRPALADGTAGRARRVRLSEAGSRWGDLSRQVLGGCGRAAAGATSSASGWRTSSPARAATTARWPRSSRTGPAGGLGPALVPLHQLNRLAGPPDHPVLSAVDDDDWRDDVDDLAQKVRGGWSPAGDRLLPRGPVDTEDGNHRVEARRMQRRRRDLDGHRLRRPRGARSLHGGRGAPSARTAPPPTGG